MKRNTFLLAGILYVFSLAPLIPCRADEVACGMVCDSRQNTVFVNPILGGDHPDPTIVRDGNDYYMTHSSFEYTPGLTLYHSTDLVNWEPIGSALNQYLGSVWSPDICKFKGKYYIYFTVSNADGFSTYVVTAKSPYGPWSEPVDLKVDRWIDPCHVYDEEKKERWLFLSGGHRIRLSADGLSTKGELEKFYNGWPIPRDWVVEGQALEGPKVKKIGDYYYFLNAQGGTSGPATTHMAIVARSKSLDGPWENSPFNPLIHTYSSEEKWWSKGHASLIDTPDGKWWTVYHAYDKDRLNQGRATLLEPIEMTSDGWLKAPTGKDVEKALPNPVFAVGQKQSGEDKARMESSEKYDLRRSLPAFRIGKEWKMVGEYKPSRFLVTSAKQSDSSSNTETTLSIQGQGDHPGNSSPLLFVAPDANYELSAKFEIEGNVEAGLIFYYNNNFFVGLGCNEEKINCWRRGQRRGKGVNQMGRSFWLKLRFEDQVVTGYMSRDGENWWRMQWGLEVSGYNHNTLSDFLSLLPGVYCDGKGTAKISHFQYAPINKSSNDSTVMQAIYEEVKTPYKYGVVIAPDKEDDMVDCPTVFRQGEKWLMTYVQYDGRGYQTYLAESKDLLHWEKKGRILSFDSQKENKGKNVWDKNQRGGFPALMDMEWGKNTIHPYDGKYWMTYIGSSTTGYEGRPISIGLASTKKDISKVHEWKPTGTPILTLQDKDVAEWESFSPYKSMVYETSALGSRFVMFYNAAQYFTRKDIREKIGIALSDDMLHWKRYEGNPVFQHNHPSTITGDAQIVRMSVPSSASGTAESYYVMFYYCAHNPEYPYGAYNSFAVSKDLIHWTDWKGEALVHPSESYDERYAHKSYVVKWNGTVYHFYCAVDKNRKRTIAMATSKKF